MPGVEHIGNAACNGGDRMGAATAHQFVDFLADAPDVKCLLRHLRVRLDNANNIADGGVSVES